MELQNICMKHLVFVSVVLFIFLVFRPDCETAAAASTIDSDNVIVMLQMEGKADSSIFVEIDNCSKRFFPNRKNAVRIDKKYLEDSLHIFVQNVDGTFKNEVVQVTSDSDTVYVDMLRIDRPLFTKYMIKVRGGITDVDNAKVFLSGSYAYDTFEVDNGSLFAEFATGDISYASKSEILFWIEIPGYFPRAAKGEVVVQDDTISVDLQQVEFTEISSLLIESDPDTAEVFIHPNLNEEAGKTPFSLEQRSVRPDFFGITLRK